LTDIHSQYSLHSARTSPVAQPTHTHTAPPGERAVTYSAQQATRDMIDSSVINRRSYRALVASYSLVSTAMSDYYKETRLLAVPLSSTLPSPPQSPPALGRSYYNHPLLTIVLSQRHRFLQPQHSSAGWPYSRPGLVLGGTKDFAPWYIPCKIPRYSVVP